jgi:2-iminoacetate synthase ThiH
MSAPIHPAPSRLKPRTMTEEDIRRVAGEAAREAVYETLKQLGVDPATPFEMQRDFQHLRSWRQSVETVKRQGLISAVAVFVTGSLALLWLALKGP